jgi:hypothetical protein
MTTGNPKCFTNFRETLAPPNSHGDMSKPTETKSVPIINPDAFPMMIEMFKQSVERHTAEIEKIEALVEAIEEGESDLELGQHEDLILDALQALVNKREEDIKVQEVGITELSK